MGRSARGWRGAELAELGLMARSAAAVRVFSDDGHCVADARLMRRALEYVRAFDGVIAQHAQDPQLAGAEALLPRGRDLRAARPARLAGGGRGHDRRPRRPAGRADPVPAARLPRLHRRDRRRAPLGQAARHRRHRRGRPAPPAADHGRGARLRPDLQGEPTAAARRGRRGAARRALRRDHRRGGHRPRTARPARQGPRVRRGGVRDARAGDRARRGGRDHGQPGPVRLARRGRSGCRSSRPTSPGFPTRAARCW